MQEDRNELYSDNVDLRLEVITLALKLRKAVEWFYFLPVTKETNEGIAGVREMLGDALTEINRQTQDVHGPVAAAVVK